MAVVTIAVHVHVCTRVSGHSRVRNDDDTSLDESGSTTMIESEGDNGSTAMIESEGDSGARRGPAFGRSLLIARGEFHRTLRSIRESPRELVGILFVGATMLLFSLGGAAGAYFLGRGLRQDGSFTDWSLLPGARAVVGSLWLVLVVGVAFRTLAKVGRLEQRSLLLSTVPVRDLVFGKLLAETVGLACWLAIPVSAVSVAFAVGSTETASALGLPPVAVVLVGSAIACGFVLGIAVKHVATRYEPVVRVKTPLAVCGALGYVALIVSGRFDVIFAGLYAPLQYWPVSWLADVVFLSVVGVDASARTAAVGLAFTGVLTAGALTVAPRLAAFHWLSDAPRIDPGSRFGSSSSSLVRRVSPSPSPSNSHTRAQSRSTSTARSTSTVASLLEPVTARGTRTVATVVWRRTWRSPVRLLYVLYPLFFAIEPMRLTLESLRATGTVPEWIPPLVMAYVVWAAGMAFTLNALGDQGSTLPTILTTPASARAVVTGRMLVGVLTIGPLGVVLVGGLAAASSFSLPTILGFALATTVGVVTATALATGIGVAFPRFGTISITRNRSMVVPGKAAAFVYSIAALTLAGSLSLVAFEPAWEPLAAGTSWLLSAVTPLSPDVSAGRLRAVGTLVLAGLVFVSIYSFRYAVATVETYTLE
ncbi:hypothetical protein [Natronoglomus mannanivorans]|uniref:Uncharacterized protein n=1 Tax=Natronoglomus mannanivorans TaxID=2979990 RepID=A0AAP2Z4C6_9EURY|nr:hypothetical protein [Halobacteria archaeon AArc-xg1-1]